MNAVNNFGLPDEKKDSKKGFDNVGNLQISGLDAVQDYPWIDGNFKDNDININCKGIKRFIVFIDEKNIEIDKPVNLFVNGKLKFSGILTTDIGNLLKSMNLIFDRNKLYLYSVDVVM